MKTYHSKLGHAHIEEELNKVKGFRVFFFEERDLGF